MIDQSELIERLEKAIARKAMPELSIVKSDSEATRLYKLSYARIAKGGRIKFFSDVFFIMVAPIIGAIIFGGIAFFVCILMGIIKHKAAFSIIMTCATAGIVLPPIVYIYIRILQHRKSLRIVLKEHGYPICPHCGKIREGTEMYKELDDICSKCRKNVKGIPK